MSLTVVILAAGKGTRMKSSTPKVLHQLAGKPLLGHVIATARQLNADRICVVYGHGGDSLPQAFAGQDDIHWVMQQPQLGTGHAVLQAAAVIEGTDKVLVLYGDVPLTPASILAELVSAADDTTLALLTAVLPDPDGYGRIVRDDAGQTKAIVEQKDASAEQLCIKEINTGIMALPGKGLLAWLSRIGNSNSQAEYYLTDVIALAVADGVAVVTRKAEAIEQISGINSRQQLVELERYQQLQVANNLAAAGVTIRDPARFDLRGELDIGTDVEVDINVVIEGSVRIGNGVIIEPNCIIRNSNIADNVIIHANSLIENSEIGPACEIGPFARLRPDAVLKGGAKVGNFVEIKKSTVGEGSKVNHLSYIGDTLMGKGVNVGAGTITCNYDGANKYQTIIEDGAFIGSGTQLVAPVKLGKNSTIGAGSTITKNTPENELSLSRSKQTIIKNWRKPTKK